MSRAAAPRFSPQSLLVIAALVTGVLAFLPARFGGWLTHLDTPLELALAPIQEPVRHAAVWLLGDPEAPRETDSREELQRDRDEWHAAWLQLREENDTLRRQIRELQRGADLAIDVSVRRLIAPVIGGVADPTSGLIKVRRGSLDGVVNHNTIAVIDGVQLVGRVAQTRARFSMLLPITDRNTGSVDGVVMLDDATRGPICFLEPTGAGTLRGPVGETFDAEDAEATPSVKPGMTVRLNDRTWPSNARMLVLGQIETVDPGDHPLHKIITVRPLFNIDRVSEVVLQISDIDPIGEEGTP